MSSYACMMQIIFGGVDGIGDSIMDGSIWNYISLNSSLNSLFQKVFPYMYVLEIRRNCNNKKNTCLEVSSSPTDGFTTGFIPLKDIVVLIERMYNNPLTHVGPDPSEVVLPVILHMRYEG